RIRDNLIKRDTDGSLSNGKVSSPLSQSLNIKN
ncbi:unnamed protein product, partial [Allacma fusca]